MPDDMVRAWTAEELTDQSKEAFWKASFDRWQSVIADAKAHRRTGLIGLSVGAVLAVLGLGDATWVHLKTPLPEPPRYIFVDKETGAIDPPRYADNVSRDFPESVRRNALSHMLMACEGYIPQTWSAVEYHTCMVMLTPAEQKRRQADIGLKSSPRYPPAIFGPNGWAMPTKFPVFVLQDETGKAPNQTFVYEVGYVRTEVTNGREAEVSYTANITFQFHPELKISDADRLLNPYGIQVVSFSTRRD